jgi:hypothetical protein
MAPQLIFQDVVSCIGSSHPRILNSADVTAILVTDFAVRFDCRRTHRQRRRRFQQESDRYPRRLDCRPNHRQALPDLSQADCSEPLGQPFGRRAQGNIAESARLGPPHKPHSPSARRDDAGGHGAQPGGNHRFASLHSTLTIAELAARGCCSGPPDVPGPPRQRHGSSEEGPQSRRLPPS